MGSGGVGGWTWCVAFRLRKQRCMLAVVMWVRLRPAQFDEMSLGSVPGGLSCGSWVSIRGSSRAVSLVLDVRGSLRSVRIHHGLHRGRARGMRRSSCLVGVCLELSRRRGRCGRRTGGRVLCGGHHGGVSRGRACGSSQIRWGSSVMIVVARMVVVVVGASGMLKACVGQRRRRAGHQRQCAHSAVSYRCRLGLDPIFCFVG